MILRDNKSTITESYCYYSVLPTYLSPSQLQVNFKSTSSQLQVNFKSTSSQLQVK